MIHYFRHRRLRARQIQACLRTVAWAHRQQLITEGEFWTSRQYSWFVCHRQGMVYPELPAAGVHLARLVKRRSQ